MRCVNCIDANLFCDQRCNVVCKAGIICLTQINAIQVGKLGEVETGRTLANIFDVKPFNGLILGNDFLVTVTPAKTQQVVVYGFGVPSPRRIT